MPYSNGQSFSGQPETPRGNLEPWFTSGLLHAWQDRGNT